MGGTEPYGIVSQRHVYSGRIFDLVNREIMLPNGRTAARDVILMSGAAAMLPVLDDGRVVFVRQYREGIQKEILELPAGKLDKNEEPLACAKRELIEETGYRADKFTFMFKFYPAAAYNNEILYMYLAEGLTPGRAALDDDEFLTVETHGLNAALAMIDEGAITDAKTIAALLYYERRFIHYPYTTGT